MLSIFKSKKNSITSLFPTNFVDIHSHLIPGIDDGSKSLDESVALIKQMRSYGINHFIATPHVMEGVWENSSERILNKLQELNTHLQEIGINDITIRAAAEYMLDGNFSSLLEKKDILPLKNNKILVEMSYRNAPINLYEMLFDIQVAGYTPVLAHPERYYFYHNHYKDYTVLKKAGCLFQMNLLSLTNYYGKDVQKIALKLLTDNMIDFVGSDTHGKRHLDYLNQITDKKVLKLITPILEKNSEFI